ncbi:ArsR/SmtB family transcription factor, partial [Holdemanella porci]|uniref:ArsR/SmtB family transcription factor n=1 Tax=Holdemanella porci TaxID=2652276 RepID=UPI0020B6DEF2
MQKLVIEDCLQLVEFFKTLGDSTRLRIVLELKTKRCVGELAEELQMSQSAVSHQLNIWLCHNKQLINSHFYRGVS